MGNALPHRSILNQPVSFWTPYAPMNAEVMRRLLDRQDAQTGTGATTGASDSANDPSVVLCWACDQPRVPLAKDCQECLCQECTTKCNACRDAFMLAETRAFAEDVRAEHVARR